MLLRLQIVSTGEFFVLPTDQSLSLDINTTLFNDQDEFLGSISYPGKMEVEPNRRYIKNAQYILTSTKLRQFPVMMWLGAMPWKLVTFRFTIENSMINYTLLIDATVIINQLKTLTMQQIFDPAGDGQVVWDDVPTRAAYMMATANETPGKYPAIYFPLKNDGAYKVIENAGVVMVNKGSYDASTNTPALHNGPGAPTSPAGAVPGWYFTISKDGSNDYGAGPVNALADSFMVFSQNNTWVQSTTINGLSSADYPDIAFPVSLYMNAWQMDDAGVGSFIQDPGGAPVNNTYIPSFCLPYIIRRIAAFFGFKTTGRWLDDSVSSRIVLQGNIPGFATLQADMTYFMPDMLVSDFLKDIRTELGLMIDFDQTSKVMICESLRNLLTTGRIVDLRARQLTSYRETGTLPDAYSIEQGVDDADSAFTDEEKKDLPVLYVGDPDTAVTTTDVQLISVATKMLTEVQPYTTIASNWRIPWIKMPIFGMTPMDQISSLAYADRGKFKLRLLYYHGMQPDEAGYNYPYASSDNLDINGLALTSFTLALNAAGTAYLSIRQYYNFLLNSKPAEFDFKVSPADISSIRADSCILVRDFNQATVRCLLDQMSADIRNDQEVMIKLTLYPQILPDNTAQAAPPVVPPPPPVDNGLVYVRLTLINPQVNHVAGPPTAYTLATADIQVAFFADAAGSTPKNVTNLVVRLSTLVTTNTVDGAPFIFNYTCSGSMAILQTNAPTSENAQDGSGDSLVYTYTLAASAFYTIIS